MDFFLIFRFDPQDIWISGGNRIDRTRSEPVDPAQYRILFVDDGRNIAAIGREQRRISRVTAKADDRRWLECFVKLHRHAATFENGACTTDPAARILGDTAGGKNMDLSFIDHAGNFLAARIGDQCHAMAAQDQLPRQRIGRDHMPAGAASREHIMFGKTHTAIRPCSGHAEPYCERSRYGFRRVNASKSPIPMHKANIDEPP